jgi:hypothetical protein
MSFLDQDIYFEMEGVQLKVQKKIQRKEYNMVGLYKVLRTKT